MAKTRHVVDEAGEGPRVSGFGHHMTILDFFSRTAVVR